MEQEPAPVLNICCASDEAEVRKECAGYQTHRGEASVFGLGQTVQLRRLIPAQLACFEPGESVGKSGQLRCVVYEYNVRCSDLILEKHVI